MVTIKQAAELTGVPEHTLRAWERRYGAFRTPRSAGGYRLYDENALDQIRRMNALVSDGLPPREAWVEVARHGGRPAVPRTSADPTATDPDEWPRLRGALVRLDAATVKAIVDGQFARLDFETLVDGWLMPVLRRVGQSWSRGEITVAGEHMMSNVVLRRLAAAFDAAGTSTREAPVIIGAPSGVLHDLGLMAFAVCVRRQGVPTLYLGSDVPVDAWVDAQRSTGSTLSVTAAYRRSDGPRVTDLAQGLWAARPTTRVLVGGSQQRLAPSGCLLLGHSMAAGAQEVAELVRAV
jgi:MerR family transcriptional regulator, light-induced transcriptional regulator